MDDTTSHRKTRSLARLVCLVTVLAIGASMVVGQAPAAASGTPSSADSTISVKPNPVLISEPDGSPSFEATVTVEDADGDPVSGDPVTLAVSDGGLSGGMLGSISDNPQETDSAGKATFSFTCNAGYCYAGAALEVTASDPSGLSLGPVIEYVSEIAFAGRSYAGQTDTLKIQDLAGAETKDKTVTLSLDGSSVALSGACATDSTGSLPLPGEVGACTFTVPAVQLPGGGSPPANVPAVVTVGAQAFDVTFPLQPAPALQLQPTGGPAGSTVLVGGTGFPQEKGVQVLVRFTPHGSGVESAGTNCQTNGLGGIEDEAGGAGCQLTIPADSPDGTGEISSEEYDSLTEFATASAVFTVEAPKLTGIEISENYPGCPGGPPAGPVCGTGVHDKLYVGETAGLAILGIWNTGTTELLKVSAGEPAPVASWYKGEPQPSGAITLNGVNAAGDDIGLTANKVTSASGIVQVEYDGFTATSPPLSAVVKPCDTCTIINGALLNVKAQVPGTFSSTPVVGAVANITQGGRTVLPPCIPENVNGVEGCSSKFPILEASATETCTTEAAGECQLVAGEGTIDVATEIEDTVTLTAPSGYTLTGVKGCHSESGSPEAPECHLLLKEYSSPVTVTFELESWPVLTVNVGGPKSLGFAAVENELADGQKVIVQQIDPSSGEPVGEARSCTSVNGAEGTGLSTGTPASCGVQVPEGEYTVTIPEEWTAEGDFLTTHVFVSGADENIKKVGLNLGATTKVSFSTSFIPDMEVDVGGPKSLGFAAVENELADGQKVIVQQIDPSSGEPVGEARSCTSVNGAEGTGLNTGTPASCGVQVPEGEYTVTIPEEWTAEGDFLTTHVFVSGADENIKKVGLNRGGTATTSFSTSFIPDLEVDVGGPKSLGFAAVDNELADGRVVTVQQIDPSSGDPVGEAHTCTTVNGVEGTGLNTGIPASCGVQVPEGEYTVAIPEEWTIPANAHFTAATVFVSGADENIKKVGLNRGATTKVSFSTSFIPDLEVDVGGPDIGEFPVDEDANGQVVAISPIDGTPGKPTSCTAGGGYADNTTASCGLQLPTGTYQVSVPQQWTPTDGDPGVYVTGGDNVQDVTLNAGNAKQISFSTAYLNLTDSGSGSGSATTTDGKLSATGSGGTGTVTVGEYTSNPEGAPAFESAGEYIDVYLAPGSTFTSLTFTDCELGGGAGLQWWNPQANDGKGGWEVVSDETAPSGSPPCITVTINESTSPTLKQMTGTVFGVVLPPMSTSTLSASLPPSLTSPPATTATTASVSLDGSAIVVHSGGAAQVRLTCTGTATCAGKLTLTAKAKGKDTKTKGKSRTKTKTIGTASFSIPAGKTAAVKLTLNGTGRALLSAAHGHLSATLTILKSSPSPSSTQSVSVHLSQQKATKAKQGKKK